MQKAQLMADFQDYPSPTPDLVARRDGHTGWLTFSRPERMNAVTIEMWAAIPQLIAAFEDDPAVKSVVLHGAGDRAFVAGADISQFGETRDNAEQAATYEATNSRAFAAIRDCAKPTIAMIRGYCIGGGMAIALGCDIRIASEGSTFAVPAGKLGLAYPIEGIRQVLNVLPPAFAKEVFYTARQFDHEEALAMNLLNRAVPPEELEGYTRSMCDRIAQNAPLSLAAAKRTINAICAKPETFDRSELEALSKACFESEDYAEGRNAFLEKRKPQFHGR